MTNNELEHEIIYWRGYYLHQEKALKELMGLVENSYSQEQIYYDYSEWKKKWSQYLDDNDLVPVSIPKISEETIKKINEHRYIDPYLELQKEALIKGSQISAADRMITVNEIYDGINQSKCIACDKFFAHPYNQEFLTGKRCDYCSGRRGEGWCD